MVVLWLIELVVERVVLGVIDIFWFSNRVFSVERINIIFLDVYELFIKLICYVLFLKGLSFVLILMLYFCNNWLWIVVLLVFLGMVIVFSVVRDCFGMYESFIVFMLVCNVWWCSVWCDMILFIFFFKIIFNVLCSV